MKAKSSHYILVAEIITIVLFHAVKLRHTEKHPAEMVFNRAAVTKSITLAQTPPESRSGLEYLLVKLTK